MPIYADGTSYNELTTGGDPGVLESPTDAARRATLQTEAFRTTDDYRLLFYVPGGGFQEFPAGAVKRISAGNALAWSVHYTPTGKPEQDRHRLGLWFAQTAPTHEVITKRIGEAHIIEGREFVAENEGAVFPAIPPLAEDWRITAITPVQDDVTLYALWPHMHLRGKDMTFIATYPDGHEEVLLHVPKYNFQWQLQYTLAKPVHLPAGSTIKAIGHYDNSRANRFNPRPDAAVRWSEQSWDEMFNGWMELSIDKHVIARSPAYTLATPVNSRVSLGISSGPPGTLYVRHPDGSLLTSAPIGSSPSFVEPWTFAAGQTIQTERTGSQRGEVTLTLFDVPQDLTSSATIGGLPVTITVAQPGQNARITFGGARPQQVTVRLTGNTIGSVTVAVLSPDGGPPLASTTASAASFTLPTTALPADGVYVVMVDPSGPNIGTLTAVIEMPRRE